MSRRRIYLAGPISKGDLAHNIKQATDAAQELIRLGYSVLCPQLTCYLNGPEPSTLCGVDHSVWMDVDLPWVEVSDAVLRLPGASSGADIETTVAGQLGIPVFTSIQDLRDNVAPQGAAKGHPRFHALLREMGTLHDKKQSDYGTGVDPFANIRASSEFGVPAWKGALVRLNDKITRLKTYCIKGSLANEGVIDSLMDLAVYALIARILFDEGREEKKQAA